MLSIFKKSEQKEEKFVITVQWYRGDYRVDKTFAEILQAYSDNREIILKTERGTMLSPSMFGPGYIEFTTIVPYEYSFSDAAYSVDAYRITSEDEFVRNSKGITTATIRLQNAGDNMYELMDNNISIDDMLIDINNLHKLGVPIEVEADCQTYPYVFGSQQDVVFGRIDPATANYIAFRAVDGGKYFQKSQFIAKV